MARITAVGLNHARTLAKLDQETLAARGHTENNTDTQKTVAARYNIFDRSKKKRHNFEFRSGHRYKSDLVSLRIILSTDSPNKPRLSETQFVLLRIAGVGEVLCMLESVNFLPECLRLHV
jgi:hypothetical protein